MTEDDFDALLSALLPLLNFMDSDQLANLLTIISFRHRQASAEEHRSGGVL